VFTPSRCRFHVDNLSSAHVYLRLPEGMVIDDIPPDTLEDAAQITKANSIMGEGGGGGVGLGVRGGCVVRV
jgi:hypothetical protein